MSSAETTGDLMFERLVRGYVDQNARFVRRDWLATRVAGLLNDADRRFVLLTGEPGVGKSAFMAQLARDHPGWLRYFIRQDQQRALVSVSAKAFLLHVGFQLSMLHPELFSRDPVRASLRVGEVAEGGEAIGAVVKRLVTSPFSSNVLEVDVRVDTTCGRVVGLAVDEMVDDARLLGAAELLELALVQPAGALARIDPSAGIVVLLDAVDEARNQVTTEDVLTFLTHCGDLPANVRIVLSSRPPDDALRLFASKQAPRVAPLPIEEDDAQIVAEVRRYAERLVAEPALAKRLERMEGGPAAFAARAATTARGNLGYVDALARGIDRAVAASDEETLGSLLRLEHLPLDLEGLYAFFLDQLKGSVARERVELRDAETGERYDKPAWPAVYHPILGVLAVAFEPVGVEHLARLGAVRVDASWVQAAVDRLRQFLDGVDGGFRLYHATVAEFLTSSRTKREHGDLYQDAAALHRSVASLSWTRHASDWAGCTDGYALRNLARHLFAASDVERLRSLICKGWMLARRGEGREALQGFAEDVALALRAESASAAPVPEVLARLHVARLLVLEDAGSYADSYLGALVALGRPGEAVALARLRADPGERFRGLLAVFRSLGPSAAPPPPGPARPDGLLARLRSDLERAARDGGDASARALALAELGAAMCAVGDADGTRLLDEAIEAVGALDGDEGRHALRLLAGFLADANDLRAVEVYGRAVAASGGKRDALQQLAEELSRPGLEEAVPALLEATKRLRSAGDRDYVRGWVCHAHIAAKRFDAAERVTALIRARTEPGAWGAGERVRVLCALARAVRDTAPARARKLLVRAAESARKDPNGMARCAALGEVAGGLASLADARADALFADAEAAAGEGRIPAFNRQLARSRLVPVLARAGRIDRAVALARTIAEATLAADMSRDLAPALAAAGRFEEAEQVARSNPHHAESDRALRDVTEALLRAGKLDEAERVATSIDDATTSRAEAMALVVDALAAGSRVDRAVALARSMPASRATADALAALAASLARAGDPRAQDVLARAAETTTLALTRKDASAHDEALGAIVAALARLGEHAAAEQIAGTIGLWSEKVAACIALATAAKAGRDTARAQRWLDEAEALLDAPLSTRRMRFLNDISFSSGKGLVGRRDHVDRNVQKDLARRRKQLVPLLIAAGELDRAHRVAAAIPQEDVRAEALSEVAAAAFEARSDVAAHVLEEVTEAADAIPYAPERARLLVLAAGAVALATDPSCAALCDAASDAVADPSIDADRRVDKLCDLALASRRSPANAVDLCREAWDLARGLDDPRGDSLARVARTFASLGEHGLAAEVARAIEKETTRAWAEADLVLALVQAGKVEDARERSSRIGGAARAQALTAIAGALAGPGRAEAAEAIREAREAASIVGEADERATALGKVAIVLARAGATSDAAEVIRSIPPGEAKDEAVRELAEAFARAGDPVNALATLGSLPIAPRAGYSPPMDAWFVAVAHWTDHLERARPGLVGPLLSSALDVAGWIRPDWAKVARVVGDAISGRKTDEARSTARVPRVRADP